MGGRADVEGERENKRNKNLKLYERKTECERNREKDDKSVRECAKELPFRIKMRGR